jgi:hypothetical protein
MVFALYVFHLQFVMARSSATGLVITHHFVFPTMETPLSPKASGTMDEPLTPEEPGTTVEPVTPEEPGVTTFTIYVPNFLQEYSISEESLEQQNTELLQKDWLTAGLVGEIESLFPAIRSEIKNDDDNKHDPHAFQHKIAQLFAPGHIFASYKQLDQAADMFLGAWAIKKTNHSKSI